MKKILFVYPAMMLGGSTTSLLSILYSLDYSKYKVDLLLDRNVGEWIEDIPNEVNLLEPSYIYQDSRERIIHQILSLKYIWTKIQAKIIEKKYHSYQRGQQYLEMKDVDFYRDVADEYDVAIAFLEGQPCKYVINHVRAKRKIAWIHIDYKASQFCYEYDIEYMKKFDSIVTVSAACLKSYQEMFPELNEKCIVVENILSKKRLNKMAVKEKIDIVLDKSCINFVTACRISFGSKGLDRAVRVLAYIKKENYKILELFRWYIIGEGNDFIELKNMIEKHGLSENIFLLGMKQNPYSYISKMDLFFLPSIWEGKPMAVTEAQILGLPALITCYASASEQIENGVDGMIVENSEEGIYKGVKHVLENPDELLKWKLNVQQKDYSNLEEIKKVEGVIDGRK